MDKNTKLDLRKLFASDKARYIFVVLGLCAIVLIFLSSRFEKTEGNTIEMNFDSQSYQATLQQEIIEIVESVEGAGKSKVMLTLENSYEYIYLDDDKTLRKVNEPTIRGVVVACEGGGSSVVAAKVGELVCTVLNIPSNKVCVSKLS